MYVLIVSRGYPTEKHKTNGIFEFDQAKALAKEGHKVIFAVVDMHSIRRKRHFGRESFIKEGVQIEAINIPCGPIPQRAFCELGGWGLSVLYRYIEKKYGKPDIIHAHFIFYGFMTVKSLKKHGTPIVITEHYSAMNKDVISNRLFKYGEFSYQHADKVIAVGNALVNRINDRFSVDAICIPNIVDTDSFQYTESSKEKNVFSMVSTGELISLKKMEVLIEGFHRAFHQLDNVILSIFGEGPERNNLERLISKLNLANRVFLMGQRDRKQIAEKMQQSECFILVSESETFGLSYIEAMLVGLPVIATRCGGPEDFVTNQNGVLIPVDDVEALAEAMRCMYHNIGLYERKKISDSTKLKYAPRVIAKSLTEVYGDLLGVADKKVKS